MAGFGPKAWWCHVAGGWFATKRVVGLVYRFLNPLGFVAFKMGRRWTYWLGSNKPSLLTLPTPPRFVPIPSLENSTKWPLKRVLCASGFACEGKACVLLFLDRTHPRAAGARIRILRF